MGRIRHANLACTWRPITGAGGSGIRKDLISSDEDSRARIQGSSSYMCRSPSSRRGTSGRGPRRRGTNNNAPPSAALLQPMEEREKSRGLMQPRGAMTVLSFVWQPRSQRRSCLKESLLGREQEEARL